MNLDHGIIEDDGLEIAEGMGIDTFQIDEEERFYLDTVVYHKKSMDYFQKKLLEIAESMEIDSFKFDGQVRFYLYMMSYHKKSMDYFQKKLMETVEL